jgi:hypothetical protein
MHVRRGLCSDIGNVTQLRSFFTDGRAYGKSKEVISKPEYRLDYLPWNDTMSNLEQIKKAWMFLQSGVSIEIQNWKYILQSYQNDIWLYPVLTFIYTNINEFGDLSDENIDLCCSLMRNIARYLYTKGFEYTSIQGKSMQDEMYVATECAAHKKRYSPEIKLNSTYLEKLNGNITTPRFRRGFCVILEYLSQLDWIRDKKIRKVYDVFQRADVEHILPQRWENDYYDQWNSDIVEQVLNTLGNLCLLETSCNIKGSNMFFTKKKEFYKNSGYILAHELRNCSQWTYEEYKERQSRCVERIVQFLENG